VRGEDTFSGACHHMKEAQKMFIILTEDSGTHVELGDDAKYALKGKGTIMFQLD
jgi:hypothetical protein